MRENTSAKTYQLHIMVQEPMVIAIGKLGSCEFPSGKYIYTGSGGRNIESRVSRHLSKSKILRWHIDYLLSAPGVEITEITLSEEQECSLNQATPGEVLVPRFGATDCRNGCGSHLKWFGAME